MSHELRTPLNSLLILAEMLSDNTEGNLTAKQREFAQTIYASGSDLLSLINDILDMAKIESGTMAIEVGDVPFADLRDYVERTFRPVARDQGPRAGRRAGRRPAAGRRHRREAAPAGAPEPALQRLQVHRERARSASGSSLATGGLERRPPGPQPGRRASWPSR